MTKIEWTNETWNPVVGCTKLSSGCAECYAEKFAVRLAGNEKTQFYKKVIDNGRWNGKTLVRISEFDRPERWKRPRMIFVCSMGDLFHDSVPFTAINSLFSVMSDFDRHIYQILTKRPQRVLDFFSWKWAETKEKLGTDAPWFPKPNIWIGVTAENQNIWNERVPLLAKIPTQVRFVSCEPLLSHIDMEVPDGKDRLVNWIICGSETGNRARRMDISWAQWLAIQASNRNIPFFMKKYITSTGKEFPFEELPDLLRKRQYPVFTNNLKMGIAGYQGKKAGEKLKKNINR